MSQPINLIYLIQFPALFEDNGSDNNNIFVYLDLKGGMPNENQNNRKISFCYNRIFFSYYNVGPEQTQTGNLVRWPKILTYFGCLVSDQNSWTYSLCLLPVFIFFPL